MCGLTIVFDWFTWCDACFPEGGLVAAPACVLCLLCRKPLVASFVVGSSEQVGFVVPPRSFSCIDASTQLAQGYFTRSYVKLLRQSSY